MAILQNGLLSHISSLRAFSPGPYPKLYGPCLPVQHPRLLVADVSAWATSLLGIPVRHVVCGVYLFIFPPSYVAL